MTSTTTPKPDHVVARNTAKPPKRSIAKMHELIGSALGIWQQDVRAWAIATKAEYETDTMQNDLFTMHEWLRQWRVEVETPKDERE